MPKLKKWLLSLFYIGLLLQVGIVVVLSVLQPQNHLICWQVSILSGGMLVILITGGLVSERISAKISDRALKILKILLIGIFFVGLYVTACVARSRPDSLIDYGWIYQGAIDIVSGNSIQGDYFYRYGNNIIPMLFLSKIFVLSDILHIKDPYYLIALTGIIISITAVCAACYLLKGEKNKQGNGILLVALFICFLPLWVISHMLYTDQMSFNVVIVSFALSKAAVERKVRGYGILYCILSGFVQACGVFLKVTVSIPFIAGCIALIFMWEREKWHKKFFVVWISSFVITISAIGIWANSKDLVKQTKATTDPVITWIGLGLQGDGSWADNEEYIEQVHSLSTKDEKLEFVKEYLKENWQHAFEREHLIAKIRTVYASGYFGTITYVYAPQEGWENHFLWEMCSPWGKYFWRSSQYTFGFIFGVYLVYFLGAIISFVHVMRDEKNDIIMFIADVSFVGYFLFLMLWEASNRQLYNFMPLLFVGAVLHVSQIVDLLKKMVDKKKERK